MKNAFTLIELLVVIAIIAILAAILFPVFAQAKMAAKKSSDLSNTKQLGIGLQLYLQDFDDIYPPANQRLAANGSAAEGETHWSFLVQPYIKNTQIWVSPADPNNGWAPSCFNTATNNSGFGAPSGQVSRCDLAGYNAGIFTSQVPRLSYVANQLIIPRKRRAADTTNVVSSTAIDSVSNTIAISAMTDTTGCMRSSDGEFRTYRNTLAVRDSTSIGNSFSSALASGAQLWALTTDEVNGIISCNGGKYAGPALVDHVFKYANPGRFDNGNNYVMCDTSAKFRNYRSTLSYTNWQWGTVGYSLGGMNVIDRATGNPVQ
jgi:prepilin-type N-terminal cleavage/methylation domain-containing protein